MTDIPEHLINAYWDTDGSIPKRIAAVLAALRSEDAHLVPACATLQAMVIPFDTEGSRTPRDVVAQALAQTWHNGTGFVVQPQGPPTTDWTVFADAVLAALRKHWTSDASINRLVGEPYMDWDQTYAIVAALFEDEQ